MPLFVEKTFAVLIVAVYGFTSVWVLAEAKFIPLGSEVWIFGVALIPVGLAAHALRKSFLSKHQLLTALANFELESSTCSSDFDRRFILRCIRRWYGGPEQFESFVRRELREELLAQIRSTSFRSGHPGRILHTFAVAASARENRNDSCTAHTHPTRNCFIYTTAPASGLLLL